MKKKELKRLAEKIAHYENIIQNSLDKDEVKMAKENIIYLSGSVDDLDDILLLDEMVQSFLEKNI